MDDAPGTEERSAYVLRARSTCTRQGSTSRSSPGAYDWRPCAGVGCELPRTTVLHPTGTRPGGRARGRWVRPGLHRCPHSSGGRGAEVTDRLRGRRAVPCSRVVGARPLEEAKETARAARLPAWWWCGWWPWCPGAGGLIPQQPFGHGLDLSGPVGEGQHAVPGRSMQETVLVVTVETVETQLTPIESWFVLWAPAMR